MALGSQRLSSHVFSDRHKGEEDCAPGLLYLGGQAMTGEGSSSTNPRAELFFDTALCGKYRQS